MSGKLYREDYAALRFLSETGGYLTHNIAVALYGNADLRKKSQWARHILLKLERLGMAARLDTDKPVCWRRTDLGTAALLAVPQ